MTIRYIIGDIARVVKYIQGVSGDFSPTSNIVIQDVYLANTLSELRRNGKSLENTDDVFRGKDWG